ncbi:MAG: L-aspartate oxidase [Actinomycetota bacterium]|nr:L-aspartate oxidase [Actinomycetota bacterium]
MTLDLLVLGSGVAGLSAAVQAVTDQGLRVGVLTKGDLDQAATRWAQGGVAAVLGGDPDSTDLHLADTLAAGAGLCDPAAVRLLVDEGPARVQNLIALGAVFDRDAHGELALAREGGHSVPRVVHAGGAATGVEIERALVEAVQATAASVMEGWFAIELIVEDGRCQGVVALDPSGTAHEVRARHTLMATGGFGQLYAVTTNPPQATGDGVAMALRAGVAVADMEFVQFHPTALHHPSVPRPLLSEALRGHGALVRDANGDRFVDELSPRDVVARAMAARMLDQGVDHLWLDATGLDRFAERFPTIASALEAAGLDPATDWLPIAPAAHYTIGGVVTDLDGATALPGLWAAGEVACTGVHGANRLASNSLLEGMVFAARVVEAIERGKDGPEPTGIMEAVLRLGRSGPLLVEAVRGTAASATATAVVAGRSDVAKLRGVLQKGMTVEAGVVRDEDSLRRAAAVIERATPDAAPVTPEDWEHQNLLIVGGAVVAAAQARLETRGAHTRTDHPDTSPEFQRRILVVAAPQ